MRNMAVNQALQSADQHRLAGDLGKGEAICRDILRAHPDHHQTLHLLATMLQQAGRFAESTDLALRAIAVEPNAATYHNTLGILFAVSGRPREALAAFAKALEIQPQLPAAHLNIGNVHRELGDLDTAIAAYRQSLRYSADDADAWSNLGVALLDKGHVGEAVEACRRAIDLSGSFADAHHNLGNALRRAGATEQAISAYGQAINLAPDFASAHYGLGAALSTQRRMADAEASYRRALQINPRMADALLRLGEMLLMQGNIAEAIAVFRNFLEHEPNAAEVWHALAEACRNNGEYDEAIAAYRRALDLRPQSSASHNNLGLALKEQGRLDEAVASYQRALAVDPAHTHAHSNLVYALLFQAAHTPATVCLDLRRWEEQHAAHVGPREWHHGNHPDPDRRLRVGYLSPDFRNHVVGQNLMPLFREHDREQVQLFCYSNSEKADATTRKFRGYANLWRDIHHLADEEVAKLVREDEIDILVDLTLHLAGHRLLVFARKPAPVQVTFAGYPGTTGLKAIDYRLTDPYLDPIALDDAHYAEESIRLPHSFWCFDPCGLDVPVNDLPCLDKGCVTFGCLNNYCKVNEQVLRLWAGVLKAVPESQLLLLSPEGSHRETCRNIFSAEGVAGKYIQFAARCSRPEYLRLYNRIDLGLDTFPYNGHSTSLDSFWMGVPVVTLAGRTVVGRAGVSQLNNLGLRELIAETPERFVAIASELARDQGRLRELRAGLRGRMERSPLMDARGFARGIEQAYRTMWQRWCQRGGVR